MPSGSHAGGGGSHFGGGSSGGGSHFGGGDRSGGPRGGRLRGGPNRSPIRPRHVGPRVIFIGGRGYSLSTRRQSGLFLCFFAAFILLCFAIIGGANLSRAKSDVTYIKQDYERYQYMIEYAESNPSYIVEGEITDIVLEYGYTKYYFTYKFSTAVGSTVYGYSFHLYSLDDLKSAGLTRGATIQLAVDSYPVTLSTDSIPMDYKNFALEDDEEYVIAKSSVSSATRWTVISCTLIVVLLVAACAVVFSSKKVSKGELEQTQTAQTQTSQPQTEQQKRDVYTCPYCGTLLTSTQANCPNCGAKRKI